MRAKQATAGHDLQHDRYIREPDEQDESDKGGPDRSGDAIVAAFEELESGVRDAWQRLAIARQHAEARFRI